MKLVYVRTFTNRKGRSVAVKVDYTDKAVLDMPCWYIQDKYVYRSNTSYPFPHSFASYIMKVRSCRSVVDHINHDTFDNRKTNLRVCSPIDNQLNRRSRNRNGLIGVRYVGGSNPWEAFYRGVYLGIYASKEAAAWVRDRAAEKHSRYAILNKVQKPKRLRNRPTNIRKAKGRNSSSHYFGVYRVKVKDYIYWQAIVVVAQRRVFIGSFKSQLTAALAYNNYVIKNKLPHPINQINEKRKEENEKTPNRP